MKKYVVIICVAFLATMSFVIRDNGISSIYGTINPGNGVSKVYAISGTDSLWIIPQEGKFSIAVTPGAWKLHIVALRPYKDAILENVVVDMGKATDVGLIRLVSE